MRNLNFDEDPRPLKEIWNKVSVIVTSHSMLEIIQEILDDVDTIEEARQKIEEVKSQIRKNNTTDFKEWLKRYLKLA